MANKTTLKTLKGFRDFLPTQSKNREYVITKIRNVFERFGFEPIETPTLEYAEILTGKYGKDADELMYTFIDRGDRQVGLRYDQTVPTARFLSQHQNLLPKFFRRYQIQNVFRAENTQKGRYREFLQCDCDIFGANSALADAEILAVFYAVYFELGLGSVRLLINDRDILFRTLDKYSTGEVSVLSIIQTIDKIDKIMIDGVVAELIKKGVHQNLAKEIVKAIQASSINTRLEEIMMYAQKLGVPEKSMQFSPTLARGLDYYTGLIFEGVIPGNESSSIGGGGRYDNLIEQLGGPDIPSVGFAIGFDRTIEVLEEIGKLPKFGSISQVLVTVFDQSTAKKSAIVATTLRNAGISTELYPNVDDKLSKQLKYINDQKIRYAIIIGPDEIKNEIVTLKNMETGEEIEDKIEIIIGLISN